MFYVDFGRDLTGVSVVCHKPVGRVLPGKQKLVILNQFYTNIVFITLRPW